MVRLKKKHKHALLSILIGIAFMGSLILYQKWAINKEINLTKVVYATVDIPPRTKITEKMVASYEVPGKSIPPNAITDISEVVGKYTTEGYGVSQNSMIYKSKVIKKEQLPDAGVLDLKKSEAAFPLLVDIETSLGNSIMPKTHVDLYFRTTERLTDKNGNSYDKPIFGKIASQVRVTAAKDSQAANVFNRQSQNETGIDTNKNEEVPELTKLYIFAVSHDQNVLLNQAKMIGEIVPVATGDYLQGALEQGEHEKTEEELKEWIKNRVDKKEGRN